MTDNHAEKLVMRAAYEFGRNALTSGATLLSVAQLCHACAQTGRESNINKLVYLLKQAREWDGEHLLVNKALNRDCGQPVKVIQSEYLIARKAALAVYVKANDTPKFKDKFRELIRINSEEIELLEKSA